MYPSIGGNRLIASSRTSWGTPLARPNILPARLHASAPALSQPNSSTSSARYPRCSRFSLCPKKWGSTAQSYNKGIMRWSLPPKCRAVTRHFSMPSLILSAAKCRTHFASLSQSTGGGNGLSSTRSPARPAAPLAAIISGIKRSAAGYWRATLTPLTKSAKSRPPSAPRSVAIKRLMCSTSRLSVSSSETLWPAKWQSLLKGSSCRR